MTPLFTKIHILGVIDTNSGQTSTFKDLTIKIQSLLSGWIRLAKYQIQINGNGNTHDALVSMGISGEKPDNWNSAPKVILKNPGKWHPWTVAPKSALVLSK